MTAEVAVLSRLGVALAADSAVTVGQLSKTYTSAAKLFQLSECGPVGLMVYGKGDFLNVPWEAPIKQFRRDLGVKTLNSLEEYSDAFLAFLHSNDVLFPEEATERFVDGECRGFLSFLRDRFRLRLERELALKAAISEDDIKAVFATFVADELTSIQRQNSYDALPDDFLEQLVERYKGDISAHIGTLFEKVPMTDATRDALVSLTCEVFRHPVSPALSGVVVAGFGERERYPALVDTTVHGVALGQLLHRRNATAVVGDGDAEEVADAWIVPLAQAEMVYTFMQGSDPALTRMMEASTKDVFAGVADIVVKAVKDHDAGFGAAFEKKLRPQIDNLVDRLVKHWDQKRHKDYTVPVMEMIGALPKDELAAVAESLVNLTKFKRRVSRQQESVGGPIDVAVITRGDGFIWVKRKHYFAPELNPRFFARHVKEDSK